MKNVHLKEVFPTHPPLALLVHPSIRFVFVYHLQYVFLLLIPLLIW